MAGPNQSVYKYFIEQQGISLIVTVDNGVAGHEAIAYAQEMGVDVVVTDHHSMQETLPNAYAIVHPEHPGKLSFQTFGGLQCSLQISLCSSKLFMQTCWLVAIGTIADMVSMTDENRVMVKYGLSLLKQTERVGLQELMKIAGIDMDGLDEEETVGFQLAPRLNALGRLDDPNPAIELLDWF
jgi:single-stranded-DNA-specific exonuclease